MITISEETIDVSKVIESVSQPGAGAVNIFIGVIRDTAGEKKVIQLEYEAYEKMAITEVQKIIDRASKKWEISGFGVSHRIGVLKPGEVAVVVAISTRHRKESFKACQFIIDEIKKTVPIFKKEVVESGETWVGSQ